jgi:hypothetical protein
MKSFGFRVATWLGDELAAHAKVARLPVPTEAVKKLSRDFRPTRLARMIARDMLMASVTAPTPDLSRHALKKNVNGFSASSESDPNTRDAEFPMQCSRRSPFGRELFGLNQHLFSPRYQVHILQE